MKIILTILIIAPCLVSGQRIGYNTTAIGLRTLTETGISTAVGYSPFGWSNYKVHYWYDTVLLFKGIDTIIHVHDYVRKSNKPDRGPWACAAIHGPEGCPDSWMNDNVVCFICLKSFNVDESRTAEEIKIIDRYQQAKDRLAQLQKKK